MLLFQASQQRFLWYTCVYPSLQFCNLFIRLKLVSCNHFMQDVCLLSVLVAAWPCLDVLCTIQGSWFESDNT